MGQTLEKYLSYCWPRQALECTSDRISGHLQHGRGVCYTFPQGVCDTYALPVGSEGRNGSRGGQQVGCKTRS